MKTSNFKYYVERLHNFLLLFGTLVLLSGLVSNTQAQIQVIRGDINLTQFRSATQSSTLVHPLNPSADRAVDRRRDGNYNNGSVTHTNYEFQPWLQIDLGIVARISEVRLFNRTDCCSERLSNFYVLVSDQPFSGTLQQLLNNPAVSNYYVNSLLGSSGVIPVDRSGRYVRVQLAGTNWLSLAEVEVYGQYDLALGKTASQSSTLTEALGGNASRAVDGTVNGNYNNRSVTHTNYEFQPWWQLDLGAVYSLNGIQLFNRTDCCSERLSNFYVLVSDQPFSGSLQQLLNNPAVSNYYMSSLPGGSNFIPIDRSGRYVRVQLAGTNWLSLAEVEVLGNFSLALRKTASQSSTLTAALGGDASRAVDGTSNGNYYNGSVTHTNYEFQPWWQVDLGRSYQIRNIALSNRTDCCSERLGNFYVLVSDQPFSGTLQQLLNNPAVSNYYISGQVGNSGLISVNRSGRYVRVQLAGTNWLSLAEVEVHF